MAKTHLKPFQKGHAHIPGSGRKKGQQSKHTRLLKEATLMAAELEGSDRKGRDGLVGYLRWLSRAEPNAYVRLLEKILPMQVNVKTEEGSAPKVYRSHDELALRLQERGLPLPEFLTNGVGQNKLIDITPSKSNGNGTDS